MNTRHAPRGGATSRNPAATAADKPRVGRSKANRSAKRSGLPPVQADVADKQGEGVGVDAVYAARVDERGLGAIRALQGEQAPQLVGVVRADATKEHEAIEVRAQEVVNERPPDEVAPDRVGEVVLEAGAALHCVESTADRCRRQRLMATFRRSDAGGWRDPGTDWRVGGSTPRVRRVASRAHDEMEMVMKRIGILAALVAFAGCAAPADESDLPAAPETPAATAAAPAATSSYDIALDGDTAIVTRNGKLAAHHPDRIIVKLAPGAQAPWLAGSRARGLGSDRDLYLVENPDGISALDAVRHYKGRPEVLYAEPDYIITTDATPSDPDFSQQWDMTKIDATDAWDTQTGAPSIVVAVIDTGIDFTHPDLQGNLWTDPTTGAHGFTCVGSCAAGGLDDNGHGTHVAGTIGAAANNGIGVAGVDWSVQIMAVKFMDLNGTGAMSDAILAFNQVTALAEAGVNIRVTNNSWTSTGYSQALQEAMASAEAAGVLHVCAAGNSFGNSDIEPQYPAAFTDRGIVSVMATDASDLHAYFTNYGYVSVDIGAPGVNILSTVPMGSCELCDPSGYKVLSGTSMASPHVAGVVAALFEANPELTPAEARDVLLDYASYDALTDLFAMKSSTGGRLNYDKALHNPLLYAPRLNNFPTASVSPAAATYPEGTTVAPVGVASDPDGDTIRGGWWRDDTVILGGWLMGRVIQDQLLFPWTTGAAVSFTAPSLAMNSTISYLFSATDGRGGAALARTMIDIAKTATPAKAPSGTLSVSPTSGAVGTVVTVKLPNTDPAGKATEWDLRVGATNGTSGSCCFGGTSPNPTVTFTTAGVYRISAQVIDAALNVSPQYTQVVQIGGATGQPPIAKLTVDDTDGPVPFTVNYNARGSTSSRRQDRQDVDRLRRQFRAGRHLAHLADRVMHLHRAGTERARGHRAGQQRLHRYGLCLRHGHRRNGAHVVDHEPGKRRHGREEQYRSRSPRRLPGRNASRRSSSTSTAPSPAPIRAPSTAVRGRCRRQRASCIACKPRRSTRWGTSGCPRSSRSPRSNSARSARSPAPLFLARAGAARLTRTTSATPRSYRRTRSTRCACRPRRRRSRHRRACATDPSPCFARSRDGTGKSCPRRWAWRR